VSSSVVAFTCKQRGIEATIKLDELWFVNQPTRVTVASVGLSISRLSEYGPIIAELVDVDELSSMQVVFAQRRKKALRKKKQQQNSNTVEFLLQFRNASVLFAHLESHLRAGVQAIAAASPGSGGSGGGSSPKDRSSGSDSSSSSSSSSSSKAGV
jgi:hypothetical protein